MAVRNRARRSKTRIAQVAALMCVVIAAGSVAAGADPVEPGPVQPTIQVPEAPATPSTPAVPTEPEPDTSDKGQVPPSVVASQGMAFPQRQDNTLASKIEHEPDSAPEKGRERALENIPTERLRSLPRGQKPRSEIQEIPGGFSKAEADRAERLELELAAIDETPRSPSGIQATGSGPGCQVYWPSPHLVCGAIKDKYNAMGGPGSWLSWPNSPEYVNPDGIGARSQFLNGSIYWSPSTGAHPVSILYMTKWEQFGWETGWLGYPTASEIGHGPLGSQQEFQGAGLFWSQPAGVYAVGGAIRAKYDAAGGPGGFLGYPTSDELTPPDGVGRFNTFKNHLTNLNGSIYWHPQHGAHPVSGPIFAQWASAGYEASQFGYPTADQMNLEGIAAEQQFQNSKIYTPGVSFPVGQSGVSLTLGVPSAGPMSAAALPDGVRFSGAGFEMTFQKNSGGNLNIDYLRTTSQAPSEFKLLVGLPAGYSATIDAYDISVKSPGGTLVGKITLPMSFDGSGQEVSTFTSLQGNQVSVNLGSSPSLPIRSFLRTADLPYPAPAGYENLSPQERQVCRDDLPECWNVRNAASDAQQVSYREYPDWRTRGEQDNRVDAVRHCAWLAYMTQRADEDFARRMGNAHELATPNAPLAAAMDEYNNETGVHVGLREEHSETGIEITCREYGREARQVSSVTDVGTNVYKNDLVFIHE
ncbi:hypothetical protein ONR57_12345 [Hoyosella sp. YIM 151337]|uniref:LGFP repeat-containing protein n=1 Tax=Hoyosella sp. YIM 151337 TaxID=2992742 RepID=UPI002236B5E4|nr:hypothetical protein [Hoyosella sp. YIM 151337]MCW4354090.1 hypothetical protein [Hoyosella sp. YIM 151337]